MAFEHAAGAVDTPLIKWGHLTGPQDILFFWLALGILQIEGHALEGHHRVHIPQLNTVRDLGMGRGIVEDGPHTIAYQLVDNRLGLRRGHRHNPYMNPLAGQSRRQLANLLNGNIAQLPPHLGGVVVKGSQYSKALGGEGPVAQESPPQLSHPHHRHPPLPVQPQYLLQLLEKTLDVISLPLLAKAAKIAQVLSDLGRCELQPGPQLLRAHYRLLLLFQETQDAVVKR